VFMLLPAPGSLVLRNTTAGAANGPVSEPSQVIPADELWPYETERMDLERRAWSFWGSEPGC